MDNALSETPALIPPRDGLKLLRVNGKCVRTDEVLYEQCQIAKNTGYPQLLKAGQYVTLDPIMIIGSGLSVIPMFDEIKERHAHGVPIMAVKGAHDWLIERGITPEFAIASDPQEIRAKVFGRLNDQTIYCLASQMHPSTWPYVSGRKVLIWHAMISKQQLTLPDWENTPLVMGGCTTGLRALSLAWILGFRTLELYGFDSCVGDDGYAKVDGGKKHEEFIDIEELTAGSVPLKLDRKYRTTAGWAKQVEELAVCLSMIPGCKVNAYGEGLFQEVLRQGKSHGWKA